MAQGSDTGSILGIDIGTVSLSIVEVDPDGMIISSLYSFHYGRIPVTLTRMLEAYDLSGIKGITTVSKNWFDNNTVSYYDTQTAVVAAGRALFKQLGAIMVVGAEKFQLINFDKNGYYDHTATNTSCVPPEPAASLISRQRD